MKTTKIFKSLFVLVLVAALSFAGTTEADAAKSQKTHTNMCHPQQQIKVKKTVKRYPKRPIRRKRKCVKTPIDAGLILLLTGAGAAYVGIRRKQK